MSDDTDIIYTDDTHIIISEGDSELTVIDSIETGPQGPPGVGIQGPTGPPGEDVTEAREYFYWGDATPAILFEVTAGVTIFSITLILLTAFNGVGASLSIGVTGDPELLMATNECDPTTVGAYEVTPGYLFTTAGTLRLFITSGAGASTGNGVIMINY